MLTDTRKVLVMFAVGFKFEDGRMYYYNGRAKGENDDIWRIVSQNPVEAAYDYNLDMVDRLGNILGIYWKNAGLSPQVVPVDGVVV